MPAFLKGLAPNYITRLLEQFKEEHHFLCMIGARGLRMLGMGRGGELG
jgi:hypothetical protein